MKAIHVEHDGRMHWSDTPKPEAGEGEVLIQIAATALNRADLLQRRGMYAPPAGSSQILGLECSGVVVETRGDCGELRVGDRVCTLLEGGGYAEFVAVDARRVLVLPEKLSFEEGAAIPEVLFTAWTNLFVEGAAKAGDAVLVHAAASGVGTMAIQLGRLHGLAMYGTASASKLAELRARGYVDAFDRHLGNFSSWVRERVPAGVRVIVDPVGANYLRENLEALAPRGRLVCIGGMGGVNCEFPLQLLMAKRLSIVGSVLRSRPNDEKAEMATRIRQEIWPAFADGSLVAVIDRILGIEDAELAHEVLASNATTGKVVLRVAEL